MPKIEAEARMACGGDEVVPIPRAWPALTQLWVEVWEEKKPQAAG